MLKNWGFKFSKNVKDKPFHKEMYHVINNEGTYNTSRFTLGSKELCKMLVNIL